MTELNYKNINDIRKLKEMLMKKEYCGEPHLDLSDVAVHIFLEEVMPDVLILRCPYCNKRVADDEYVAHYDSCQLHSNRQNLITETL